MPAFAGKFGATTEKLLALGVRVGTSPPKVDPLGEYTVRLFGLIDGVRPGSAAILQARAVVLDMLPGAPSPKSGDTDADAILDGRVDASIVYCLGRDRYARLVPDATLGQFPPDLRVGPECGLAVLEDAHPAASLLALAILSPEGQRIMAQRSFMPVTLPTE